MLLCSSLPLVGMSTPTKKVPLSPSNSLVVITPNSKKVRMDMLRGISKAIERVDTDENLDPELLDPEVAQASPKSFLKITRKVYSDLFANEFENHGVTPALVEAQMSPARASIKDLADATDRLCSPASTPVKKAGEEIAKRLGQTLEFRRAESGIEAYLNDDQVVIDEALIKQVAQSPESLKVIAGHEAGHKIGNDQVERVAYTQACQKVAATKELEEIKKRKWRSQETFADLTPALHSPTLAKAYKRVIERFIAQDGAGTSQEYPTNFERRDLAIAAEAFHEQHAKEKQRKIRRSLLKEFDEAA